MHLPVLSVWLETGLKMRLTVVMLLVAFARGEVTIPSEEKEGVIKFLKYHGYLSSADGDNGEVSSVESIESALGDFRSAYNLPTNGTDVASETVAFIKAFWCGTPDNYNNYDNSLLANQKWNTNNLTWIILPPPATVWANRQYRTIADRAFKLWEAYTNLSFRSLYSADANIVISFTDASHYFTYGQNQKCAYQLSTSILGHAYYPNLASMQQEIHLYKSLDWYLDVDTPPSNKVSLLSVLTHEIGHVLGISHSGNAGSIMYPYYQDQGQLSAEDIAAIQNLYGQKLELFTTRKPPTSLKPTTRAWLPTSRFATQKSAAETPPVSATAKPKTTVMPTLCEINSKTSKIFLVVNNKLFIFYEKYVWMQNLNTKEIQNIPMLIADWLKFLPYNFENITAIYQRPNGIVVLFLADMLYSFEYGTFKLLREERLSNVISHTAKLDILGTVNSYKGRTYWFFNDNFFMEIDECNLRPLNHGLITEHFTGVPSKIDSVFRYTNGLLYFVYNGYYYEYDEFTNTLKSSGKMDLNFFGISCPNVPLLEQLKLALNKVISMN